MKVLSIVYLIVILVVFASITNTATAQSEQDDIEWLDANEYTLYWGEEINSSGYLIKATEFSLSKYNDLPDDFVIVSVVSNRSDSWNCVLSVNNSDIPDTKIFEDELKISAVDIVTGNDIPTPYAEVEIYIAKNPLSSDPSYTWINATLDVQRITVGEIYIDERAYVDVDITNLKGIHFKNVSINETVPDNFVLDPDTDVDVIFDLPGYNKKSHGYYLRALKPGNYTIPATEIVLNHMGVSHYKYTNDSQLVVHGPYINITKTLSTSQPYLDDIVNVEVNIENEGDRAAYVDIYDELPEGTLLLDGNTSAGFVMRPSSKHTLEYSFSAKQVGDIIVPSAKAKFTDPKGYSDISESQKYMLSVSDPTSPEEDTEIVEEGEIINEAETPYSQEDVEEEVKLSDVRSIADLTEWLKEIIDSIISRMDDWFRRF